MSAEKIIAIAMLLGTLIGFAFQLYKLKGNL